MNKTLTALCLVALTSTAAFAGSNNSSNKVQNTERHLLTKTIHNNYGMGGCGEVKQLIRTGEDASFSVLCSSTQYSFSVAAKYLYIAKYAKINLSDSNNIVVDASARENVGTVVFKTEAECRKVEKLFNTHPGHIELILNSYSNAEIIAR